MIELDVARVIVDQRFQDVWRQKGGAVQYRHYTQQDLDDLRDTVIQDLTQANKENHHEPPTSDSRGDPNREY